MIAKEIPSIKPMMIETIRLLNLLSSSVKNLFSQIISVGSEAAWISISCPSKY